MTGAPKPSRHRVASLYSCSHQLQPPAEDTGHHPCRAWALEDPKPTWDTWDTWDLGPLHGLRISLAVLQDLFIFVQGQLVPEAMLDSADINGDQAYQQDFSNPAWDQISKAHHILSNKMGILMNIDVAAIIDPAWSPSPSIC